MKLPNYLRDIGHRGRNRIPNGSAHIFLWQVARAGMQGVWILVVARILGSAGYGLFAGFAGLAATLGAFSGIGFGLLLLQNASRDGAVFSECWFRAVAAVGLSSVVLLVVYLAFASSIAGHNGDVRTLVAIAIPELASLPLAIIASYAFQIHGRMGWAGAMYALGAMGNLLALTVYVALPGAKTLPGYLFWHLLSSVLVAGASMAAVLIIFRPSHYRLRMSRSDVVEAASFTAMRVVDTGLGSIDKTLVLRLAGSDVAGQYSVAYRMVAFLALPIVSVAVATTPTLFRTNSSRNDQKAEQVKNLLKLGCTLGVVMFLFALVFSNLIPVLFGQSFDEAGRLVRILAPMPLLLGLAALGCAVLMSWGGRGKRILIQLSAMALMVVSMYALVRGADLGSGAAFAAVTTYTFVVAVLWRTIQRGRAASLQTHLD